MVVSKQWLEAKIKTLNEWLFENENHTDYVRLKSSRDYYVNKLIELEENQVSIIKV